MKGTEAIKRLGQWLFWAIMLSLFLVSFLTGCSPFNSSSKEPRIRGNKLYLPKGFNLTVTAKALNVDPPVFTRFDQQYPSEWPAGLVFPEGTYVNTIPIELSQIDHPGWGIDGYLVFNNSFVLPLENEETVNYLVTQTEKVGYTTQLIDQSPNPYTDTGTGTPLPIRKIQIKLSNSRQSDSGYFLVIYDENMQNYTYTSCLLYDPRMTVAH